MVCSLSVQAMSRSRKRFTFWFNTEKDGDLIDEIPFLKVHRQFTRVLRDGMRLILDLRQGSLEVLFELFPFIKLEFLEYMRTVTPTTDIERKLAQIIHLNKERAAATGGHGDGDYPVSRFAIPLPFSCLRLVGLACL